MTLGGSSRRLFVVLLWGSPAANRFSVDDAGIAAFERGGR
jgi:hypothetical protein